MAVEKYITSMTRNAQILLQRTSACTDARQDFRNWSNVPLRLSSFKTSSMLGKLPTSSDTAMTSWGQR